MNKNKKLAFFDIDGTLYRWSLFAEYVDAMLRDNILPQKELERVQEKFEMWKNRKSDYEDYISALVEVFDKNISGLELEIFLEYAKKTIKNKNLRVYRFTRDLIKTLKKRGYFLVAISHSAKFALDIFTESYKFDKSYGVMFEIENGKFTGNIMNRDIIFNKGKVVERFLKKNPNFTLKDSIAIGDTESDIAMLDMAEHKIAFNPNRKLFEHAKKKDWNIVIERKDVIYRIKNGKLVEKLDFE